MAITQNNLEILKSEIMADTDDGGGLPTGEAVVDGVSNNLFPDVSDIDRLIGRVRLRKVSLAVNTANADLLQATRMLFTELPNNPNISVFAFKATSFADRRSDAKNKIESYLAFGTKWAGHLLETQLSGQRVIQISLDKGDTIPAVGKPLVLVQNEGQSDEFYQYLRPLKVDVTERLFQSTTNNSTSSVLRTVATIEFGDPLSKTFNGLSVSEFFSNASTARRAILREARIADAAKYYSATRLTEPVVAMQSRQVRVESIYTQVVPSTQVETPILQRDPANQVATQARGGGVIDFNQSVNATPNTAFSLASGISIGTLSLSIGTLSLTDRDGQLVDGNNVAYASIKYGIGQITWYDNISLGQTTVTGSYTPASEFTRVAQTDYQIVDDNAGYNYVRELAAEPLPNSLKITYVVLGNNYLVHDDGRGSLIDDDGNGRGTIQGKTVLLTTAAIPDAGSHIIYTFGIDLSTTKYGSQALAGGYHVLKVEGVVTGNITVTWASGKTATVTDGVITGDATGTFTAGELHITPTITVAPNTVFNVSYNKIVDTGTERLQKTDTPQAANGVYSSTITFNKSIENVAISVVISDQTLPVLKLVLIPNTAGTGLVIRSASRPNGLRAQEGTGLIESWQPMQLADAELAWITTMTSSSLDKVAGTASFSIKVHRRETFVKTYTVGILNPYTRTKTVINDVPMYINVADVDAVASLSAVTEVITAAPVADKFTITLPQDSASPVINGSLFITVLGKSLNDVGGTIKDGTTVVGNIDYKTGVIVLTAWQAGVTNAITLKTMLRENDPAPLANVIFRTPVAPLKTSSLAISAELEDGTVLALSTNAQGGITGHAYAHGTVDFKSGVVALYFYERMNITANPALVNEPWYFAEYVYTDTGVDYINRPVYAKPDLIRYNAIAYSYLPLDKELIGLDPVRLPSDGRVPFVRKGDSIAITELKTKALPTNAVGDTFNLGFERLSDVHVVDSAGKKVDPNSLDINLDAGILTLNALFDVSLYTTPLTAKFRIMDIALVVETDISGRVTLSTAITHDYTTAAVFSSMLLAGDMRARAFNVFSQQSWTSVFSDTVIGNGATSQLQVTNNPIVITNRDAIEERWALVFTGSTSFRIVGETVGEIGVGSTGTVTSPLNPMTNQPYFTIPIAAWGSGWSANNVVRFNTQAAKYPVWIGNAIQQHQGSSSDNYDFTIGYHANIDRERV